MSNITADTTTSKAANDCIAGIYELARKDLTTIRDGLVQGNPLWVVSAWKHLLDGIPEDYNFKGEAANDLANDVMRDVGEDAAFSGLTDSDTELGRYVTCMKLASAYRQEQWPRLVLRDYLRVFEAMNPERAEVLSQRAWDYAQILYNGVNAANSMVEKKAA